jgi:SAM-dependent methyltransferase
MLARAADLGSAAARRVRVELDAHRAPRAAGDRQPEDRFTRLYRDQEDPWSYGASDYEQRKYDLTIAALPRRRYRSAYEPACGTGELTARLAPRCDSLLASDVSPDVVSQVRERLAGLEGVRIERHNLPDDFPTGPFDLVLLAEFGYYLPRADLEQVLDRAAASVEPGGHLLAVHGRGSSADIYQPGDVVHRRIFRRPGMRHLAGYRERAFRIDLFERR